MLPSHAMTSSVGTVVGMSVAITVLVLCGISMVAWVLRERRRHKMAMMSFSLVDEKREKPLPALPAGDAGSSLLEVTALNLPHLSQSSLLLKDYAPFSSGNQFNAKGSKRPSTQRGLYDSLDIEGMLDIAALRSDQTEMQLEPSTAQRSFPVLTERNSSEESATVDSPGCVLPLATARLQLPPPSAFPFRRHTPLDVPKDLTPVRLSFSSGSVIPNSSSEDGRLTASLVFEGLDDGSGQRPGFRIANARWRKVVEEKPFTIRKKVTFADDVDDSDEQGEVRPAARVDKKNGLMFLPSVAGSPGSYLDRWRKTS